jgi:phosphonate transport system ATP-binding protein
LLRSLNGLVRPTAGRISVGDIGKGPNLRKHRRGTGVVLQQHHLIGCTSTLDNVLTGRLGYHSSLRTLLPFSDME